MKELSITKLGFRYVVIKDAVGDSEKYWEVLLGLRVDFEIKSVAFSVIEALANLLLTTLPVMGEVFGQTVDKILIQGNLGIEFDNITFRNKELPEAAQRIFAQHDFHIRATKLPELVFQEDDSTSGFPNRWSVSNSSHGNFPAETTSTVSP